MSFGDCSGSNINEYEDYQGHIEIRIISNHAKVEFEGFYAHRSTHIAQLSLSEFTE